MYVSFQQVFNNFNAHYFFLFLYNYLFLYIYLFLYYLSFSLLTISYTKSYTISYLISDMISELKSWVRTWCAPRCALNTWFLRNKYPKCAPIFCSDASEVPRSPLPSVEKCPDSTFLIFYDTPQYRTVRRLSKRLDFSEKWVRIKNEPDKR